MQDNQTYNLRAGTFSLFWLSLLFQNPLEQVSNVFKYYDEMLALVGKSSIESTITKQNPALLQG